MKTIGICINARISSKRCPRKLVRDFAGTTLLDIALTKLSQIDVEEKCLAAGDQEIIDIYQNYKNDITLLLRQEDAISTGEHDHRVSFRHYGQMKSDYILIMNPCLPFTSIDTYNRSIEYFRSSDCKSLTSVLPFKDIFFDESGKVITLPDIDHISSTTCRIVYKMAHIFHIINKSYFMKTGKIWSYDMGDPDFLDVPAKECLDVDNEDEFLFCSGLYTTGWR